MVLHRAALFALKKHEVALRAFYCLLIDYSSLERSEALAEGEAVFEMLEERAVRPEEMAQGISLRGFSFPSPGAALGLRGQICFSLFNSIDLV